MQKSSGNSLLYLSSYIVCTLLSNPKRERIKVRKHVNLVNQVIQVYQDNLSSDQVNSLTRFALCEVRAMRDFAVDAELRLNDYFE